MLPDAIEKSEIRAAGGVVPVHCVVVGELQSTAVEPPVPVVPAPPVSVPVAAPPVSVPVTAPPVVTAAAPPVGVLTAPPVATAAAPPVGFAPPPTAAPAPPPLPVVPPLLALPPTLPVGLLFVVVEPQPITKVAITSDSNPMPEIIEARRVVMTKTPFSAERPASSIPIACGKLFISGTFQNSRVLKVFLRHWPFETGIDEVARRQPARLRLKLVSEQSPKTGTATVEFTGLIPTAQPHPHSRGDFHGCLSQ